MTASTCEGCDLTRCSQDPQDCEEAAARRECEQETHKPVSAFAWFT